MIHRLSAIMFTDIVDFTRKTRENETRMLKLLEDHNQIVRVAISNHAGEIVKQTGDGFLIRFDSAVNAVECGLEIQEAQRNYNLNKLELDQVQTRIGIHLGDIVISENDVFGDGVNVASRIYPLAEPGGICITRSLYDIVKRKIAIKALSLGPQRFKNVDEDIEVFHLLNETISSKEIIKARRTRQKQRRQMFPYVASSIALLAVILVLWQQGFLGLRDIDIMNELLAHEITDNPKEYLPPSEAAASDLTSQQDVMDTVKVLDWSQTVRILSDCETRQELFDAMTRYHRQKRIFVGVDQQDVAEDDRNIFGAVFNDSSAIAILYFNGRTFTNVKSGEVISELGRAFSGKRIAWFSERKENR